MLVYFGKDGTLKEVVSSYTLSNGASAYKNIQGSSSNEIYCYYEGRDSDSVNTNSAHITFAKEGVVVPADVSAEECGDWSINFDRKQDLRFFEYEKPYRFAKFSVPSEVLGSDGLACATSRLIIDTDIYAYGLITFNVSKSVVLKDSYITQSQYDYLLSLVTNVQVNVGDGLLKEEGVVKVDWTKVASVESFDNLNKVMPTDIDYKDGLTLMHDTTEITGQTDKLKFGNGLKVNGRTIGLDEAVTETLDEVPQIGSLIEDHVADKNNPHGVTKAQVGLGNVVNAPMDREPTSGSNLYVSSGGVYDFVHGLVDGITGFNYLVVNELPTASEDTVGTIYLVADKHSDKQDFYDEYITIKSGDGVYSWEKIGNTDVDLSGYVPITRTVNGKALGEDISLVGSDVGITATGTDNSLEKLTLNGKEWEIKGNETYTNATPTPSAIGGIAKGTTFENKTMKEMWDTLLYPYIAPSGLSYTASAISGTFEKGTTLTLSSIGYSFSKNSGIPSKLVLSGLGTNIVVAEGADMATSGTFALSKSVTANASTKLTLTYDKGTINSNTITTTFVDPYFYGVGASGVSPTTLTKLIQGKGNKTLTFSPSNQYIVFAYPASYGHLRSIKDSNGFENINGFTETTATLSVKSGSVSYYVYTSNTASTQSGFALTFAY